MGDFHPFADAAEHHGVLAHDVAAAHGGKADGFFPAFAGVSLAPVNRAVLQRATKRVGNDFAHSERGAGRRVDFHAVVGFEHFHVIALIENTRRHVQEFEDGVDANRHVGREDDGNTSGGFVDFRLACRVEPRRANHHRHASGGAAFEVDERPCGAGKVNQAIAARKTFGQVILHTRAAGRQTGEFGGIAPKGVAARLVEGGGKLEIFIFQDGFNQHAPHATGSADDTDSAF